MISRKSIIMYLAHPVRLLDRVGRYSFLKKMDDESYLKMLYKDKFGRALNLANPQTFNEKLQWLKLYDRNPLYSELVDKYEVRKHIAAKIGEEYLIPLVGGPWNSFDEIDFDKLPDQFVLKCTHDSGGLVICRDKSKLDLAATQKRINASLKHNYYWNGREWPYKNVKPRIIAEKYMEDPQTHDLKDYKFFSFNGQTKALFIATERHLEEETKFDFFDMEFDHLDFRNGHPNAKVFPKKPKCFEQMHILADKLSKGIPHVRVDFYEVDGRIYFGEMTFFHWSGLVPFEPEEWDKKFGDWINLPECKCD